MGLCLPFSLVFAWGVFYTNQGGTGTSSIPTVGQILVGQLDGSYGPQSTSTLGIFQSAISTFSNIIQTANGSVTSPAYSFSNSSTTGLYSAGANTLNFSVGGSNYMSFSANAMVISGAPLIEPFLANSWELVKNTSATNPPYTFQGATSTGIFSPTSSSIGITSSGTEVARFTSSGLGIGTTTPNANLQITGSSNATTTVIIGQNSQTKGSCLIMYDNTGTKEYVSIVSGSFKISTTACN